MLKECTDINVIEMYQCVLLRRERYVYIRSRCYLNFFKTRITFTYI